jgi:SAM-dependent methyltransferase
MDYSRFNYDEGNDYLQDHEVQNKGSYEWYISLFKKFIKAPYIEIGAGVGTVSSILIQKKIIKAKDTYLVEPNPATYKKLVANIKEKGIDKKHTYNGYLKDLKTKIKKLKPKTLLYFNVLEHVPNDVEELEIAHSLLEKNGRVIIFVPAIESLYSPRDLRVGHYRRYYKGELERKLTLAGFTVEESRYTDLLGAIIWLFRFKLLRSDSISNSQVGMYNSVIVPINKVIEKIIPLPYGKNLIAVGKKTSSK